MRMHMHAHAQMRHTSEQDVEQLSDTSRTMRDTTVSLYGQAMDQHIHHIAFIRTHVEG